MHHRTPRRTRTRTRSSRVEQSPPTTQAVVPNHTAEATFAPDSQAQRILHLQRTLGNQAVTRLLTNQRAVARVPSVQRKKDTQFGMANPVRVKSYAKQAYNWAQAPANSGKPVRAAVQKIVDLTKSYLSGIGVPLPAFNISSSGPGSGKGGLFQWEPWAIHVDDTDANPDPATISTVGQLEEFDLVSTVNVVWHEARHAEQFWLIARMLAGKKMTAAQIHAKTKIKMSIINKAVNAPLKKAEPDVRSFLEDWGLGFLVDLNDAQAAAALQWYDINFGAHKPFTEMLETLGSDLEDLFGLEPPTKGNKKKFDDFYAKVDPYFSQWASDFAPNMLETEYQRLNGVKGGDPYAKELFDVVKGLRSAMKSLLKQYKKGSTNKSRAKKVKKAWEALKQAHYLGYRVYADERDAWKVGGDAAAKYVELIEENYEDE